MSAAPVLGAAAGKVVAASELARACAAEISCTGSDSLAPSGAGRLATFVALPAGAAGTRLVAVVARLGGLVPVETLIGPVPGTEPSYPALTPVVPAAYWYEREVHDLFGLVPEGHPRLDPLVLPLAPGSPRPAPGAGPAGSEPARGGGAPGPLEPLEDPLPAHVLGEGVFTIPYGPVRSGVFEAVEYLLESPGEDIDHVRTRIYHKHRGVERQFDGRSPGDGALLAERVEGVASVAHALAYCAALERLSGAVVPVQAELVRAVHAELERIANHLDSTLRHTEASGQAVAQARFSLHKERVLRLRARLCGHRFGRGVVVPGGTRAGLRLPPEGLRRELGSILRPLRADMRLLLETPSFLDRLRTTGVLSPEVAARHGALGPVGRGSGLDEDVRLSRPYGAYPRLRLQPAHRDGGDALARQLVRAEEIETSFRLLLQCVEQLSELGEPERWSTPLEPVDGAALGWAEAPQGEVLTYVETAGGRLARVKPRSASFHNLALFSSAFPKDITTDFAFIEASFGLSIAGAAG